MVPCNDGGGGGKGVMEVEVMEEAKTAKGEREGGELDKYISNGVLLTPNNLQQHTKQRTPSTNRASGGITGKGVCLCPLFPPVVGGMRAEVRHERFPQSDGRFNEFDRSVTDLRGLVPGIHHVL